MPSATRRSRRRLPEFELIKTIERRFAGHGRTVLTGIGDDAAVLRLPRGVDLLLTTDLLAEDVHFSRATDSWPDIGYKAVVANVSDIAAMGGRPLHLVVALAIPADHPARDSLRLYQGIAEACRRWNVALVGGDTSVSRRDVFISLALTGSVPPGRALTRSGARVGDDVYVTGTLGDARAGLALLGRGSAAWRQRPLLRHASFLVRRHRRPSARVEVGAWLAEQRLAHAAIDVSDGVSGDVRHICEQSHVGIMLEDAALPISPALEAYAGMSGEPAARWALAGGEDYELLFTASSRVRRDIMKGAARLGFSITRIGRIVPASQRETLRLSNGRLLPLPRLGYEHFGDNARMGLSRA